MTGSNSTRSLQLDVIKGNPNHEELAALTAVMLALPSTPKQDSLNKNTNTWLNHNKPFLQQQIPAMLSWKDSLR